MRLRKFSKKDVHISTASVDTPICDWEYLGDVSRETIHSVGMGVDKVG